MGNVVDVRREMTKTKEQLEEEKKISLSIRIRPLELDGNLLSYLLFVFTNPNDRNGPRRPQVQGQGVVGVDREAGDREIRPGGADSETGLRCEYSLVTWGVMDPEISDLGQEPSVRQLEIN